MSASLDLSMQDDLDELLPAWRPSRAARSLSPGQIIGDRWTLDALIGEGAFGAVWLARSQTGAPVAIKLFHKREDSGFVRELGALLGVDHPHIVGLRDFGYLLQQRYIVYDYIPGGSLRALLHERGTLPIPDALTLLTEITRGLIFAHERKIIHRDLKPENILLGANDAPFMARIADFGLAASSADAQPLARARYGTPGYAAPEMIDGPHDRRADLYALGVLLYEAIFGRRPFDGDAHTIHRAQRERPLSFPRTLHPLLRHMLQRMLHPEPDQRYQDAADVLRDLQLTQAAIQEPAQPHAPGQPLSISQRWERQLPSMPQQTITTPRGDLVYLQPDGLHALLREGQHLHLVHTRQPIRAIIHGSAIGHLIAWEAGDRIWLMERGAVRHVEGCVLPASERRITLLPGSAGFVIALPGAIEIRQLDGALRRRIDLPTGGLLPDLLLSADGQTLWLTSGGSRPHLLAISTDGTPSAQVPLPALPLAMTSAQGGALIVGTWGRKQLRHIDPSSQEQRCVALTERLTDLFDIGSGLVAAASQDHLTIIDAASLAIVGQVERPRAQHAASLFARAGVYLLEDDGLGARVTFHQLRR
jgi:hypothetical protein